MKRVPTSRATPNPTNTITVMRMSINTCIGMAIAAGHGCWGIDAYTMCNTSRI